MSHAGSIVLDPNVTYTIKDSLLLRSHSVLDGNGATIKLAKGLPSWGYRGCPISKEKAMIMAYGNSGTDISIKNLTVDGSQSDYYPNARLGTSLYNMATLIGCNGLKIEDSVFKNGCNDAILFSKCYGVDIDGITVNKCGHDGVSTYYVDNISVINSIFINRTNSSCRFYNVTKGEFINNKCSTSGGGHTGLQLQGELKDITASDNYIRGLPYPGIRAIGAKMSNVVIEDNVIEKCKSPGIYAPGAILRNNKIAF